MTPYLMSPQNPQYYSHLPPLYVVTNSPFDIFRIP